MKRRVIGMLLAALLALGGTLALVGYVQTAKKNAVASEVAVSVYVVDTKLPKGATAEAIRAGVHLEQVPTRLKQDGAVVDLADIDGKVAAVDLLPGEQLVAARLIAPGTASSDATKNLMLVSVQLDPEEAVGGQLSPGDTVGVFLSFEPPVNPHITHLEFQKVVVTAVQIVKANSSSVVGSTKSDKTDSSDAPQSVSADKLVVTLALTAAQSEQFVFAAEFGHVWLGLEPATVDETGTRIVTVDNVYSVKQ